MRTAISRFDEARREVLERELEGEGRGEDEARASHRLDGAHGANRLALFAALLVIVGIVLSGPLAIGFIHAKHPQPPWKDAATFADAYHWMQSLPYLFGLALVSGVALLVACVHAMAKTETERALTSTAMLFTAVFSSLVFLNYVAQTTVIPALIERPLVNDSLIALLSMSNPTSFAWALEMWGWGFAGLATALVAPTFRGSQIERGTSVLFLANGVVSVVGTALTVAAPGWVMSPSGIVLYGLWNALLLTMCALAAVAFARRLKRTSVMFR